MHIVLKAAMKFSLSSLVYHDREWFVFQEILSHLSKEKAELATRRSKESPRYTSRLGISKDWVIGDRKIKLVERRFIEDVDVDSILIFSSVLIVREHFEQLVRESFNRPLTLDVEQFTLTEKLFTTANFEWNFDPKQKDVIKTTKIVQEEKNSPKVDKKKSEKENVASKGNAKSSLEIRSSPRSLKRRRSTLSNNKDVDSGEDSSAESTRSVRSFTSSVCESVILRPRKKAKEATDLISMMATDIDTLDAENKIKRENLPSSKNKSPSSKNKSPSSKNKSPSSKNNSPSSKNNSPSSKNNSPGINSKLLEWKDQNDSSEKVNSETPPCLYEDNKLDVSKLTLSIDPISPEAPAMAASQDDDTEVPVPITPPFDGLLQQQEEDDDTEVPVPITPPFDGLLQKEDDGDHPISPVASEKGQEVNSDNCETTSSTDCLFDEQWPQENNTDAPTIPVTFMPEGSPDVPEPVPSNVALTNETSSLNSSPVHIAVSPSTLIENIKQQENQLCSETDDMDSEPSPSMDLNDSEGTARSTDVCELESSTCDGNDNVNPQIDHDADCATSSVCSCSNQNGQTPNKFNNKGATDLLDGLIATGYVSHVRQLLQNINGDKETKVSQMDQELKALQLRVCQRKKSNQQIQLNIKKKARELEKMFENLRKGKAQCQELEQKCTSLECEKAAVDAKLKKCLEFLNSID